MVRCLVKEPGADVNKASHAGNTPLCMAAQKGHLEVVRCVIKELGADVNQSLQGATHLAIAAGQGRLELVRFLVLELHADVNRRNRDGATPLYIAA
jgi:hypothetical protein